MRAAFSLAILCLAVAYTYLAFAELDFLSSTGRLGPGFFPRTIGLALIGACLYCLYADRREDEEAPRASSFWRVTLVVAGFSTVFVLLLNVLGGLPAMILYMLATLSVLNRGRPVQNVLVGVLLPVALFLMFDTWLNAAMPRGIIDLPG